MIFNSIFSFLMFSITSLVVAKETNPLRVVVTLPDFIEVVEAVGGDKVQVEALLSGQEDPHFVDVVPAFVSKVANADVVCAVGLELEVGWLPKVLAKSANAQVQPGGRGNCELGRLVTVIEKPEGAVDRSQGDVHAGGNPHFNLSPLKLAQASQEVLRVLSELRPDAALEFVKNAEGFESRMSELHAQVAQKLAPISGVNFLQYHKEFSYFFEAYGLKSAGSIEEKPGVPPSSARLAKVAQEAKGQDVRLALGSLQSPESHLVKFGELSGLSWLQVPVGVRRSDPSLGSIASLQNHLADEILKKLQPLQKSAEAYLSR